MKCWEYKKCNKTNTCPAYPDHGYDCHSITLTKCFKDYNIERIYLVKLNQCMKCDFYINKHIFGLT